MSGYRVVKVDDVLDVTGDRPGEMRMLKDALGAEQVALTYRVLPPGYGHLAGSRTAGHSHKTQEEIYFLLSGTLLFKLDGDEFEVGPLTAVRVSPEVTRTMRNEGDEDATMVIVSTSEVSAREDAEIDQDFWPE